MRNRKLHFVFRVKKDEINDLKTRQRAKYTKRNVCQITIYYLNWVLCEKNIFKEYLFLKLDRTNGPCNFIHSNSIKNANSVLQGLISVFFQKKIQVSQELIQPLSNNTFWKELHKQKPPKKIVVSASSLRQIQTYFLDNVFLRQRPRTFTQIRFRSHPHTGSSQLQHKIKQIFSEKSIANTQFCSKSIKTHSNNDQTQIDLDFEVPKPISAYSIFSSMRAEPKFERLPVRHLNDLRKIGENSPNCKQEIFKIMQKKVALIRHISPIIQFYF